MWNTLITDWFALNSHGVYEIEPVVIDWVITDNTEKYYSFGYYGIVPNFQRAAWYERVLLSTAAYVLKRK